jgi:light-regulated signal transduction histidine kinase (bacteriophytochrome)
LVFREIYSQMIPKFRESSQADQLRVELKKKSEEIEYLTRELESFTYSISHDLRAPLRHIEGFSNLLEQRASTTQLDDQTKSYLKMILSATKEMGKLIDGLLSLSRSSREEPARKKVSLKSLVEEVRRGLSNEIENRRISWKVGDLPKVYADPSQLRMVMTHLISNALKFTQKRKEAVIEIGADGVDASETIVYVRDNGAGFDMQQVNRLFQIFQHLHSPQDYPGIGVGLAMVARIIHRHGGRVWAEGELEKGATFFFTLPNS